MPKILKLSFCFEDQNFCDFTPIKLQIMLVINKIFMGVCVSPQFLGNEPPMMITV